VRWYAEDVHHFAWSVSPDYIYEQGRWEDVTIRVLYRPGDEESLLETWNLVFAREGGQPPRSREEWEWAFRRNPAEKTVQNWIETTPDAFLFSLKAHQRITHFKRLKEDAREPTEYFLKTVEPLRAAGRLGVILFQLPPNLERDVERLESFAALLPEDVRCAFEFRHESWFDDAVYRTLADRNLGFCLAESEKIEAPPVETADFVYFRLRKPDYSADDRAAIADQARGMLARGKTVFLYFKHEDSPDGALYAEQIRRDAKP